MFWDALLFNPCFFGIPCDHAKWVPCKRRKIFFGWNMFLPPECIVPHEVEAVFFFHNLPPEPLILVPSGVL